MRCSSCWRMAASSRMSPTRSGPREIDVQAIKAHFDGKKIKVPDALRKAPPGEVLVIVEGAGAAGDDSSGWLKAQEAAFRRVWDNDEDAVYDSL